MSQLPSALSNKPLETTPKQPEKLTQSQQDLSLLDGEALIQKSSSSNESGSAMAEYYQLQRKLYFYTLTLMGLIFFPVWYFYSLNTALNYLLGAGVSVVYLRFLAKDVERLGQQAEKQRLGSKGLGIFVIMMLVASKWQQLSILPVFLGFLTYKGAIVFYMLQSVFLPHEQLD
ncbi:MAG TPA: ATP synthase subunit I [Xenococcaceae cyanobacterium]